MTSTTRQHVIQHRMQYGVFGIVVFLLIAFGVLYSNGWRITPELQIVKAGTLEVVPPVDRGSVFIDEEERRASSIQDGVQRFSGILPGAHSIIFSRDGFWPWTKEVIIESDATTKIMPFVVPQNARGFIVSEDDPEYETIQASFEKSGLPKEQNKILSRRATVAAWVTGSVVFAEWIGEDRAPAYFCNDLEVCEEPIIVLSLVAEIRTVVFYKNREDVLIVASGDEIFAVDIDTRSIQNFQPLYAGEAPDFRVKDDTTLYVKDGASTHIITY